MSSLVVLLLMAVVCYLDDGYLRRTINGLFTKHKKPVSVRDDVQRIIDKHSK